MRSKAPLLLLILVGLFLQSIYPLAQENELIVVASHSILADVAQNVAGDHVDISSLIPIGADPHSFIPSPSDLTTIAKADLVLLNGAGFEESLLQAIENAGEAVNIIVASACIEILPFGATMHADDEHEDEHDDEPKNDIGEADMTPDCADHDAEAAALIGMEEDHNHIATLGRAMDIDCGAGHDHEDEGGHGAGGCDPHLWMDPHNVIYWTLTIRDSLAALDHDHAEAYAANATAYASELVALEADFILPALEALPLEHRVLITSHESLGYFAATFDFELITTIVPGMSTLVEPSARDMVALIDLVRAEGVPAIFGDTFSPDRVMSTIAGETDVAVAGLYSDTLSESDGPAATYLDYMRYNVTTIVDALKP